MSNQEVSSTPIWFIDLFKFLTFDAVLRGKGLSDVRALPAFVSNIEIGLMQPLFDSEIEFHSVLDAFRTRIGPAATALHKLIESLNEIAIFLANPDADRCRSLRRLLISPWHSSVQSLQVHKHRGTRQ